MTNANTSNDDLEILRHAQPSWRADNLGVRGNPVEFHRQQARINWPQAEVTRRTGGVTFDPASAASPNAPDYTPGS